MAGQRGEVPETPDTPDMLGAASSQSRRRLGMMLIALGVVAVLLTAANAPPALRSPVILLAATLLPGYPFVVRLPVDLVTLLALDVCASLAVEATLAFGLVQAHFWYPRGMGLLLAGAAVGATRVAVLALPRDPS